MAADGDVLPALDQAALTPRYWATFGLITLQLLCEVFDFSVVAFLVSAVAPTWKLSYGQTTVILLAAGVGAIFGALGFGWLADRLGRKVSIVGGAMVYCLCAGGIALIPDGAWVLFAVLRFLVGVGYGGALASQFALITEYTPTRHRTLLTSSLGIPASMGVVTASIVVSALFPVLGWRGVAALGLAPIVIGIALAFVAPESIRWLLANGQTDRARRALISMFGAEAGRMPLPSAEAIRVERSSPRDVLRYPRRFWLLVLAEIGLSAALTGVMLWGPTILAQLLDVPASRAARYFIFVSVMGLCGRTFFAWLPSRVGRVPAGQLIGYAGAVALACAALLHDQRLGPVPVFLIFLVAGQFFFDGGFSNLNTYGAELFPVRMAGSAMGVSQAAAGMGKIIGPLALGLFAGAANLVSPHATRDAILPGFLFLAGCCLMVGVSFSLLGVETHKRPMTLS